jgi:hypothetical protein
MVGENIKFVLEVYVFERMTPESQHQQVMLAIAK